VREGKCRCGLDSAIGSGRECDSSLRFASIRTAVLVVRATMNDDHFRPSVRSSSVVPSILAKEP
jgi:hypothetical protein